MESSSLMTASAFAKMCNVTTQTVLNWVSNGVVTPAQRVGNKSFFSTEQYIRLQITELKKQGTQSYLGVIIAESEEDLNAQVSKFLGSIQKALPNARKVDDLYEYFRGMLEAEPFSLDAQTLRIYKKNVLDALCADFKTVLLEFVMEVYDHVPDAVDFSLRFFLSLFFGEGINQNLVDVYNELNVKNLRYTINGMKNTVSVIYTGLLTKYGVPTLGSSFPLREAYYHNVGMVDLDTLNINQSAPLAKKLYEKLTKTALSQAKKVTMSNVYKDGFYSILTGVGSLSVDTLSDLSKRLANDDYMWLYIHNFELLPESVRIIIDSHEEYGKLRTIRT